MSWNYRMTREKVTNPDGTTQPFYGIREVYYDADGKPNGWGKGLATFGGDTPGEAWEGLLMAQRAMGAPVLDLDTREETHVTYHGKETRRV